LILRINRAAAYFRKALENGEIEPSQQILAQVARLVWLFHVSPIPVTIEILKNAFTANFLDREEGLIMEPDGKAFAALCKGGNVRITDFDPVILSYLRCGYIPAQVLRDFIEQVRSATISAEYQRRSLEAYEPYGRNFRANREEVIRPVRQLLDDYADKMDLTTLKSHCEFLETFGSPTTEWWFPHVKARVASLDRADCELYLSVLKDGAARELVQQRLIDLTAAFDAKATIERIVEQQGWSEEDFNALNSVPERQYEEWIRNEEGDLLRLLGPFLRTCLALPQEGARWQVGQKIIGILQGIAAENPVNQQRVRRVLGIQDTSGKSG
jgi:hypothetical protein